MELNLPKAKGLFITGTDTGVGKTIIAGGIARLLSDQGYKVGVFKPVATGCRKEREGLVSSDAEFLAFCANCDLPLSVINPVSFFIPAAPIVCQEYENHTDDFEQIATAYNHICQNSDVVIVEGIGGIRVPVTQDVDVLSLAKEFDLPVVIVARPSLGTINHTLLTVDAVRTAQLKLAAIIINGYNVSSADIAVETAPGVIADLTGVNILSIVPFDEDCDVEQGLLGQLTLETLADYNWAKLAGL